MLTKPKATIRYLPLFVLMGLVSSYVAAELVSDVVSCGGSISTSSGHRLLGTVGQTAIGTTVAGSNNLESGFWPRRVGAVSNVDDGGETINAARGSVLNQNWPNPFNPITTIAFELARPGFTDLSVYDIRGRLVTTVIAQELDAGLHTVTFDGVRLASGTYFYRLKSGDYHEIRKMLLVK